MSDEKAKYDFNFITLALGLVPAERGKVALNPGAISHMYKGENGQVAIIMHGGANISLTAEDMAELEETIKRRGEDAKAIQKEAMRNQLLTQQEVIQELSGRVQTPIIGSAVPKRRHS
jgi:hypothetical protein